MTAAVAADAFGPERVLGVAMPAPGSPAHEEQDAERVAAGLGIGYALVPLEGATAGPLHGDMVGGFSPLKDCPKTLLYRLAEHRNARGAAIPGRVLDKETTAQRRHPDLPPYTVLDRIVERYIEYGEGVEDLIAEDLDAATTPARPTRTGHGCVSSPRWPARRPRSPALRRALEATEG